MRRKENNKGEYLVYKFFFLLDQEGLRKPSSIQIKKSVAEKDCLLAIYIYKPLLMSKVKDTDERKTDKESNK